MAPKLKTYDPDRLVVTFGTHRMQGFAPDGRITITFPVQFNRVEGTDGEVGRGKTNATAVEIEVPLLHTSSSNDALMAFYTADVAAPTGAPLPFFYSDIDSAEYLMAPGAWIPQLPQVVRKAGVGIQVWKFMTGPAQYFIGGHVTRI